MLTAINNILYHSTGIFFMYGVLSYLFKWEKVVPLDLLTITFVILAFETYLRIKEKD